MNFFLMSTHSPVLPTTCLAGLSPVCSLLLSLIVPTLVQTCPTFAWIIAVVSSSLSLLPSHILLSVLHTGLSKFSECNIIITHTHIHTPLHDKSFSAFPRLLPDGQISLPWLVPNAQLFISLENSYSSSTGAPSY